MDPQNALTPMRKDCSSLLEIEIMNFQAGMVKMGGKSRQSWEPAW